MCKECQGLHHRKECDISLESLLTACPRQDQGQTTSCKAARTHARQRDVRWKNPTETRTLVSLVTVARTVSVGTMVFHHALGGE